MPRKKTHILKRFVQFIIFADYHECWEWTGALRNGYGVIGAGSRKSGIRYAHRLSFLFHHGYLPDKKLICHTCDNRKCVNPAHLYAGTYTDNLNDRYARTT